MDDSASRYEDMGDGILRITQTEDRIEMETTPPMDSLTFTRSGGQSDNTYKALKKLFCSMREDNEERPQRNNINESSHQSRTEDGGIFKFGHQGELIVSSYADVKVTINSQKPIKFKSPESGGISKHTYKTAQELILAMQEDNKAKPQKLIITT